MCAQHILNIAILRLASVFNIPPLFVSPTIVDFILFIGMVLPFTARSLPLPSLSVSLYLALSVRHVLSANKHRHMHTMHDNYYYFCFYVSVYVERTFDKRNRACSCLHTCHRPAQPHLAPAILYEMCFPQHNASFSFSGYLCSLIFPLQLSNPSTISPYPSLRMNRNYIFLSHLQFCLQSDCNRACFWQ